MPKIEAEVQEFVSAVGASFPNERDREYALFSQVPKRGNYFVHPEGFMIIKLSRSEKPFWGLGKKHVEFLNELLDDYYLVLLESSRSGYLFDKKEVNRYISRGAWNLSGSDYKINVSSLPVHKVFRTVSQFLDRLRATS